MEVANNAVQSEMTKLGLSGGGPPAAPTTAPPPHGCARRTGQAPGEGPVPPLACSVPTLAINPLVITALLMHCAPHRLVVQQRATPTSSSGSAIGCRRASGGQFHSATQACAEVVGGGQGGAPVRVEPLTRTAVAASPASRP